MTVAESMISPLIDRLTAFADDELILAHRNSEWVIHAPLLEEDIAIANIAQDELGHAMLFFEMIETLGGQTGDQLAFFRDPGAFRNVQLVELPIGDWAFTILRQFLFDAYQHVLYGGLLESNYQPIADAAAKIYKEEMYHLRHHHAWVARLGLGSDEANRRMQTALNRLWPFCAQLFVPLISDLPLIESGIVPDVATLRERWEQIVIPHLSDSGLTLPAEGLVYTPQRSEHTEHLTHLLAEMQSVARMDPGAVW